MKQSYVSITYKQSVMIVRNQDDGWSLPEVTNCSPSLSSGQFKVADVTIIHTLPGVVLEANPFSNKRTPTVIYPVDNAVVHRFTRSNAIICRAWLNIEVFLRVYRLNDDNILSYISRLNFLD